MSRFVSLPPEPALRIFCDFDGTIVREDIGARLFLHFGNEMKVRRIIEQWKEGKLTAVDMYRAMMATVNDITRGTLDVFLDEFELDPGFARFSAWAAERSYQLLLLSDGFDYYIEYLLKKACLRLPVKANRLIFTGDGRCEMEFPYADENCPDVANCKRNHVVLTARDEDRIVYIGNGRSDFDAVQYADTVFAKDALETFCQNENISFRRYRNFSDVQSILEDLIRRDRLRKPRQAEINRRQLWTTG